MAKRSTRSGPLHVIEKSLSDAQKLVAGYISSGSDQVTDTIHSLRRIFENRQLAAALKKARATRLAVAGAVGGRVSKKRKPAGSRRKAKTRGAAAKRRVKAKSGARRARG